MRAYELLTTGDPAVRRHTVGKESYFLNGKHILLVKKCT